LNSTLISDAHPFQLYAINDLQLVEVHWKKRLAFCTRNLQFISEYSRFRFKSWRTTTVLTLFIVFVLLVLTGIFAYRRLFAADSEQEERLLHDYE